jgi:hypothetical protein
LPFFASAIGRFLEEYPSVENGLSRTEETILERLAKGPTSLATLWVDTQEREEAPFMGDSTFFLYAERLARGPRPLAKWSGDFRNGTDRESTHSLLEITELGRAVLTGEADWIHIGGIDRWYGGVHLTGYEAEWRWDKESRSIVRRQ